MTIIKSFAVGLGDTYYIRHVSDNFSIIDCNLYDKNRRGIVDEILAERKNKNVTRFISTHPDEDHLHGLEYLDERLGIRNFYCVKNNATKKVETDDFIRYCQLRDSDKAFYIYAGCSRRWMNESDEERGSAGINILWPVTSNLRYKDALKEAERGESFNNISAVIKYSLKDGVTALWMGDLETEFMEAIKDEVMWPQVDVLFAPHHGRNSGKLPKKISEALSPKLMIIGEAASELLNYPTDQDTLTQNTAGDITFQCVTSKVHIYVSNANYSVDFLEDEDMSDYDNYIGTLNLDS